MPAEIDGVARNKAMQAYNRAIRRGAEQRTAFTDSILAYEAAKAGDGAVEAWDSRKIERDPDDPSREYIPLPGGWEVQTKGSGSSYRLLDKKTGERHLILSDRGWKPLQAFFTRFAHEVFAASQPPAPAKAGAVAWVSADAMECLTQDADNEVTAWSQPFAGGVPLYASPPAPCLVPPYLTDRCACPTHATPPAHEAIPDAYQQIKDGKWVECSHFVALGFGDTLAEGCRALYLAPPAPAAPAGMVWTAAEAVFRADNINHSMLPFAEQPVEVHARYKRLAMAALASATDAKDGAEVLPGDSHWIEPEPDEPEPIDWYHVDPKNCPRCGSGRTWLHSYLRPDSAEVCRVECKHCDFRGREEFGPETAITDWNAMVPTPPASEASHDRG